MLSSRVLTFVSLAAIVQSAPTLPAKDLDRKGVMPAFEVGGASTATMAAENEALKAVLKAKNDESGSVKGQLAAASAGCDRVAAPPPPHWETAAL